MLKKFDNLTMIAILTLATFILLLNQIIYTTEDLTFLKSLFPILNFITLTLVGIALYSIKEIGDNAKKKIEEHLLKNHLKQIEELIETLHLQRHEHTRHVQTIQAMLYLNEFKSAISYIDGISENYYHVQDMVYVGNPALTALLNSKSKVAENKHIHFDFAVKCDLSELDIPPWDLCSILGNILDNAFEAVIVNENDRKVGLEIKLFEKQIIIYIYNNGPIITPEKKKLIFESGYTTKSSGARGYGLFLVKKLVKQYGGKIEVKTGKRTVFIIYFPLKEVIKNGKDARREIREFIR